MMKINLLPAPRKMRVRDNAALLLLTLATAPEFWGNMLLLVGLGLMMWCR